MKGVTPLRYTTITRRGAEVKEAFVITETMVCIYVNGQELVTIMASPQHLDWLTVGFLANEGIIHTMEDIEMLDVRENQRCVDVWLAKPFTPPQQNTLTSGCGKGVTFTDQHAHHPPVTSDTHATSDQLWGAMRQLNQAADLYSQARGVHTSALSDGQHLAAVAEDIGRHNTLDKLRGHVMMTDLPTDNLIIVATGRISSEMISKARQMNISMVCSRTSPTSRSVALADEWHITLVGYLRRNSMNIYTHPYRIKEPDV